LSIIDLGGAEARAEIIGDQPAPGVEYVPLEVGFEIRKNGEALYRFDPEEKRLTGVGLRLPECVLGRYETRIGSNRFSGSFVSGFAIGIAVSEDGIGMGVRMPEKLAKLVV